MLNLIKVKQFIYIRYLIFCKPTDMILFFANTDMRFDSWWGNTTSTKIISNISPSPGSHIGLLRALKGLTKEPILGFLRAIKGLNN